MGGTLKLYGINRIFILGAGFSAPLGMPLTSELLGLVYKIAVKSPWYDEHSKSVPHGMGAWLVEELEWYFPLEDFSHQKLQKGNFPENVDVEKFLSYAYATSAFGEQWDEQGDKFTCFLRKFMGEAIYNRQVECFQNGIPPVYQSFINSLQGSLIMTFNWDTVVENLLNQDQKQYSYDFPATYKTQLIPIIKLHGSIDWFSNLQYKKQDWMKFVPVYRPTTGIEDGEIKYGDPVLFKAQGNLLDYYKAYMSPRLIAPGYDKLSQVTALGDYWKYPWMLLQDNLEVIVIGFSMRPDDYHSRAFIYPQLVDGSRNKRLKVKVIDHATDDRKREEVRARFEGVDNIEFWFDGFNEGAINFINSK